MATQEAIVIHLGGLPYMDLDPIDVEVNEDGLAVADDPNLVALFETMDGLEQDSQAATPVGLVAVWSTAFAPIRIQCPECSDVADAAAIAPDGDYLICSECVTAV